MREIGDLQETLQRISEECNKEAGGDTTSKSGVEKGSDLNIVSDGDNKLMAKIELLQDRWDALSQILEAQSQRVILLDIYAYLVVLVFICCV